MPRADVARNQARIAGSSARTEAIVGTPPPSPGSQAGRAPRAAASAVAESSGPTYMWWSRQKRVSPRKRPGAATAAAASAAIATARAYRVRPVLLTLGRLAPQPDVEVVVVG